MWIIAAEHKDCIQHWQWGINQATTYLQLQQKKTKSPFNKQGDPEASNHLKTGESQMKRRNSTKGNWKTVKTMIHEHKNIRKHWEQMLL